MKKTNYLLMLAFSLLLLLSCDKKYNSAENISHLEYLGINDKPQQMTVKFFSDELSNGVFIPKEKISAFSFNLLLDEMYLYPNPTLSILKEEYIVDGQILKHMSTFYNNNNPIEIKYFFNNKCNIDKIISTEEHTGREESKLSYDKNGNLIEINTKKNNEINFITNFQFDDNNLLLKKSKASYKNGERLGYQVWTYKYKFSADKIYCTMSHLKDKKVFEITSNKDGSISFGNKNYLVQFNNWRLISEEEYDNNSIIESTKITYDKNKIISKELTDNKFKDYTLYNINYENDIISNVQRKKKGTAENFVLKYNFDSNKNWQKLTITNDQALKKYSDYSKKIDNYKRNIPYPTDELEQFQYRIKLMLMENSRDNLALFLSQKRCEREFIY